MDSQERWYWLYDWLQWSWLGTLVADSTWLPAALQAAHLLGMCLFGGALLTVDLRMLGVGLRGQRIDTLATQLRPWLLAGLAILILTGLVIFPHQAVRYYYNTSFWVKMVALVIGLVFMFTIRNRVAASGSLKSTVYPMVGAFSIVVWFVVAAAGRWIGFS